MFGNRSLRKVARAAGGTPTYRALFNTFRVYEHPLANLRRYLNGSGDYPYRPTVRTPLGAVRPLLVHRDDLLTVNEIFCRLDYNAPSDLGVVVDLGSNIGISALYFLTRNQSSFCYLYEPDPRNIEVLQVNLADFSHRYVHRKVAVAERSGEVTFGTEPTGRYGGIGASTLRPTPIVVECVHVNDELERILAREQFIDILKVDIENLELETIQAIAPEHLRCIRRIYVEQRPRHRVLEGFDQHQVSSVCRLTNRSIGR